MSRARVLARRRKIRCLGVRVRADARADVRNDAGFDRTKPVPGGEFDGRETDAHRNTEPENLAVVDEGPLARLRHSRDGKIDEVPLAHGDVDAAAPERRGGRLERSV